MDRKARFPFQFVVNNRHTDTDSAIRSLDPRESVDLVLDVQQPGCVSMLSAFLPLANTETIELTCKGVVSQSAEVVSDIGMLLHRYLRPHHRLSFVAEGSAAAEVLFGVIRRLDGSDIADTLRLYVFGGQVALMSDEDTTVARNIEGLRQLRNLRSIVVNTDGFLTSAEIKHLLNAFTYIESCVIRCSCHDAGNISVPPGFVGTCDVTESTYLDLAFGRPGLVKYDRRAPSNAVVIRQNG